jgi:hypothetical protein
MNRVTLANICCLVFNVLFACLLCLTTVALIQERSADIVRITVPESKLLESAGQAQILTNKYARAYPIRTANPRVHLWRVVVDHKSRSF